MISRLFFNRRFALVALIFSIGMVFVALSSATEAAPPTPDQDDSKLQLEPAEAEVVSKDMAESGLYIVQLHDAPLASYRGGIDGLRATNPAAKGEKKLDVKAPESVAYLEYLDQKRAEAITEVGQALGRQLSVAYEYKASLNGFAAEMTPAEAAMVAKLPTIKHIEADTVEELHTDAGPAWIGAPAIWGEDPNIKQFEAQLSPDNEVPPVMTDTSGIGMFTYNMTTGELQYTIEHDALNVTAMHIHTGTAGVIGGAAFPLDHTTGTGTVTLTTDAQRHALMNEGYYVNVHTTAFPDGELRGQITALHFFNTVPFEADLSGLNEDPPVTDTMASGVGTFSFDAETNELDYMIEVSDIMSITKAHIHTGTVGTTGSSLHWLYDVTGANAQGGDFPISGTVTLSDTELAALWTSGLYINVHTEDNPGGELRGQIEQVGTFGEGIIVGIIDTGIDPWNPSFLDVGDDGYDHTNPWGDGTYVGVCDPDDDSYDPDFPCNDKLIGTWGYATVQDGDPRDSNGHGSHTGSTAAGNVVFNPTVETPSRTFTATMISGVAPHANVIAYAACCTGSALTAARDQVVMDGVDVVNYSIGSSAPTGDPWGDAEEAQWLAIRDAGIFVATSAGNSGPGDETVGSPGDIPWITTVGANSHNRAFLNSVTLDDGTNPAVTIDGLGMTGGLDTPVEVVFSIDFADPDNGISEEDARLCADGVFSGTVDFGGAIVVCERGTYGRVAKGQTVADAGAGGYILAQPNEFGGGPGAVASDPHVIPGVHIDYYAYQDLLDYVNNAPGAVEGTISGATLDIDDAHADVMASFSSRGANRALADMIVPNVTAPGRSIWAAYGQGDGGDGDFTFNVIQGTSMSSPHVAGSGALMMASHPDWTPAEIESALMTTARHPITNDDGTTDATPFAEGSGEVDLRRAPRAGIVLDITTQEFEDANPAEGGDPKALNRASMGNSQCLVTCSWTRTVRSTLGVTQTWNAALVVADGVTLTGSVEPATFNLAPEATQELTITVDVSGLPEAEWFFAELMLTPSTEVPEAHMPIAVQSSTGVLPTEIDIHTRRNAGSQLVEGIQAIEITDLTVNAFGLSQGTLTHEMLDQDSDNTDPYDDLTDGVFFITMDVPADSYSLIAETVESSAPDMDLFVGLDSDGDGMPEAGEQLCSSTTGTAIEFCELASPAEGTYWVLVQNWGASDSPPDSVTLVTAVIPTSDSGNITIAGPDSVPSGEFFDLRVFWDTPEMMAGDRWYGYLTLGTDGANAGNIGTVPVYLNRHEDDVTKEVSEDLVEAGEMVTYTITVQPNVTAEDLTYSLTDAIPAGMTYVADSASATEGTVDVTGDTLTWAGSLPTIGIPTLVEGSVTGYVSLGGLGVDPFACPTNCDDGGFLITGLDITYQGQHYTQAIWSINGTLELGVASGETSGASNQELPDPAIPNNLLAPWWTDLDLSAGGNWYFADLTNGVNNFTVFEWENVPLFGDATSTATFQIWLLDGSDQIWFTYDEIIGDTSVATVGVENQDGTFGHSYYYDGAGTLPSSANDLMVTEFKEPVVITFQAMADEDAPDEVTNTVDHNTDNPGSIEASASATTEVYNDGIDDETEDGAPNGGDGNGDGIPDSEQDNVASLPNAGDEDGYVTFETPEGISLTDVSASPAPMTLPTGIEAMPQGLFNFTIEGLTFGESVTVTFYLYGSESELDSYLKYDEANDTWIDVSSIATFETVTISDTMVTTIMLELTDGGLGDLDGEENGIIVDPGGPARTAPTSISLANFGQEASLAWQPVALLALLLVLMAGGGFALLQRRRTV